MMGSLGDPATWFSTPKEGECPPGRAPDGRRAGERSKAVVSVVDVFPTLIAALDLGSSGDVDGVDLMGPGPEDRPGVYFESYSGLLNHGWSPLAGWADAQGKYVHSAAPELFDPIADPGETTDLLTADGARTESYRRRLAELSRLPTLAIEGIDTDTEALMAELERLGYAASGSEAGPLPDPLDECDRPSPHARMAEAYAMGQAAALGDAGELEEGADALRLILDGNPHNLWVRRYLGTYLLALDRPGEAEPHFRALLEAGAPDHEQFVLQAAKALYPKLLQTGLAFHKIDASGRPHPLPGTRYRITAWPAAHSQSARILRIEGDSPAPWSVCYSGDTGPCPELVEAATGVDWLVIECTTPDDSRRANHLTARDVAEVVAQVRPKGTALVHLSPLWAAPSDAAAVVSAHLGTLVTGESPHVVGGTDGLRLSLPYGS